MRELKGKYGRLKVVSYEGDNVYKCQCECGELAYVTASNLRSGNSKSCGCLRREQARERARALNPAKRHENSSKDSFKGTRISTIKQRRGKHNKSGHKGVCWDKRREKWLAYICLAGKTKHLGAFGILEDAVKARKNAETEYYKPILEAYEANTARNNKNN